MNWLNKIRKWPIEKKRIFSISVAVFLTIIIIILNYGLNLVWRDESNNIVDTQNNPIDTIQDSLSKIVDQAKPILDQAFSSSTQEMTTQATQTDEIIDQINSTSSSFGTTSDVVQ